MDLVIQASKNKESLSVSYALKTLFNDYKPNTKRAYARALSDFQRWGSISELSDLKEVNALGILEYKRYLKDSGKKPASINQTMSVLRKVFKVLTEFGYLDENPFKTSVIRSEKVNDISNKGSLTVAQLTAMMEANERFEYDERISDLVRVRNRLLLKFLYLTAARRSEAANLIWDDLQQHGSFYVALVQNPKSGVPQKLKVRNELYEELEEWKEILIMHDLETSHIFPSLSFRTMGQKMTGKGVNDVVSRLGKAVGLEISAHYLRHTAITLALELGEPLQKVQAYARHASANTTIRYYHDREILQKNPTDRLPMI